MTVNHVSADFVRGDTWKIIGTMLDEHGAVMDLSGAIVEWALVRSKKAHLKVTSESSDTVRIIDAAAGRVEILLPPAITAAVPAGTYTDRLRVTIDGVVSTMWRGPISVDDTPFTPPA